MFVTASLAARIERAETGLILDGTRAASRRVPTGQTIVREMNGGVAAFIEPGSPFNKVAGLGFAGVPEAAALDTLESGFGERKAPLQFEVSTLADPALVRALTARGYLLIGFENVLGLPLDASRALDVDGGDVTVSRASDDEAPVWLDTVATGFMTPDVFDGPPSHETIPRDVLDRVFGDTIAAPSFERYLARMGGAIAGGASLRIQNGVAQLNGAATRPEFRRRGVQTALLGRRLADAARRGCDLAVVTTQPGSKSQENVQKSGFVLLYARAVLVKE
jgi:GNAT superfamily N-acetyltransferase